MQSQWIASVVLIVLMLLPSIVLADFRSQASLTQGLVEVSPTQSSAPLSSAYLSRQIVDCWRPRFRYPDGGSVCYRLEGTSNDPSVSFLPVVDPRVRYFELANGSQIVQVDISSLDAPRSGPEDRQRKQAPPKPASSPSKPNAEELGPAPRKGGFFGFFGGNKSSQLGEAGTTQSPPTPPIVSSPNQGSKLYEYKLIRFLGTGPRRSIHVWSPDCKVGTLAHVIALNAQNDLVAPDDKACEFKSLAELSNALLSLQDLVPPDVMHFPVGAINYWEQR